MHTLNCSNSYALRLQPFGAFMELKPIAVGQGTFENKLTWRSTTGGPYFPLSSPPTSRFLTSSRRRSRPRADLCVAPHSETRAMEARRLAPVLGASGQSSRRWAHAPSTSRQGHPEGRCYGGGKGTTEGVPGPGPQAPSRQRRALRRPRHTRGS